MELGFPRCASALRPVLPLHAFVSLRSLAAILDATQNIPKTTHSPTKSPRIEPLITHPSLQIPQDEHTHWYTTRSHYDFITLQTPHYARTRTRVRSGEDCGPITVDRGVCWAWAGSVQADSWVQSNSDELRSVVQCPHESSNIEWLHILLQQYSFRSPCPLLFQRPNKSPIRRFHLFACDVSLSSQSLLFSSSHPSPYTFPSNTSIQNCSVHLSSPIPFAVAVTSSLAFAVFCTFSHSSHRMWTLS